MRVKNDNVLGQDWNNEDKKKMEKNTLNIAAMMLHPSNENERW